MLNGVECRASAAEHVLPECAADRVLKGKIVVWRWTLRRGVRRVLDDFVALSGK
jgi:hypothetical protein